MGKGLNNKNTKTKRHKALEKYLDMPVLKEDVQELYDMKEFFFNCDRTTLQLLCLRFFAMNNVAERYIEELEGKIIDNFGNK